jgi:thiol-disulfide isomerase/thioredoxin
MSTGEIGTPGVASLGDGDLGDAVGSGGTMLVAFRAEWCGGCRRMEPIPESVAADTGVGVRTVDVETHPETAIESGARTEAELRELVATCGTRRAGNG